MVKQMLVEDHIRKNKRDTVLICLFMLLLLFGVIFAIGYALGAPPIFSTAIGLPIAFAYILITYSFSVLGLKQLFCSITEDNEQSLRLFIKHGFVITGQKTDWIKRGDIWLTEYFLQLVRK